MWPDVNRSNWPVWFYSCEIFPEHWPITCLVICFIYSSSEMTLNVKTVQSRWHRFGEVWEDRNNLQLMWVWTLWLVRLIPSLSGARNKSCFFFQLRQSPQHCYWLICLQNPQIPIWSSIWCGMIWNKPDWWRAHRTPPEVLVQAPVDLHNIRQVPWSSGLVD